MNQVANRCANQPMIECLMIKQQIKDWNGMLSFLISFHENKESIVYYQKQDAERPNKITISISQVTSDTSYKFEAVYGVNHDHDKSIVNKRVMFSDERDNEIQSKSATSNSQPNEW